MTLQNTMVSRVKLSNGAVKVALSAAATLLFSVPQLLMYFTQASFITLANEAVAYRYFFAARLALGEKNSVWLPQGHITSLVQRVVYALTGWMDLDLWGQINAFGLLYGFFVVVIFGLLLTVVSRNRFFTARDVLTISAVPLLTIYLLTGNFNYATQPDYQHLNMVVFAAATALFIYCLRSRRTSPADIVLAGTFIGLCAANKLSLLAIGGAAASPLLLSMLAARDWRALATAAALLPLSAAATAAAIFWALYGFDISAAVQSVTRMMVFAANPGEIEPLYLTHLLDNLWDSPYLISVVTAIFLTLAAACVRPLLGLLLCATGLIFIALIWHRPAGSTAFDAACAMIAISAMAFALLPDRLLTGARVALLAGGFLALGIHRFPMHIGAWFINSHEMETVRVDALRRAESAGHPIIAVIPDNNWAVAGPLAALLKGNSEFPTWHVRPDRKLPIAVPLSFRHTYSDTSPNSPYPDNATITWEDPPGLDPLMDSIPALRQAAARRDCQSIQSEAVIWICIPR